MTPNQLKSRQRFIKATPLPDRASCVNTNRRQENYIEKEESTVDNYDTFFEYEEELSQLKPSNSQVNIYEEGESCSFIEMEEHEDDESSYAPNNITASSTCSIEMQEYEDDAPKAESYSMMQDASEEETGGYMKVKGFDFIQCEYMKKDGHRCKRQAPKGSTICSIHKKVVDKNRSY